MGKTNNILDNFGNSFVVDRPPLKPIASFDDAAMEFTDSKTPAERRKQVPKKPANDCYTRVPCELSYKPSDSSIQHARVALATMYAGNEPARIIDMSMEALGIHRCGIPQK